MDTLIEQQHEQTNKQRARIVSAVVHILLIILAFIPLLQYPDPPPGQEGVLISFGQPDVGMGNDDPAIGQPPAAEEEPVEEEEPEPEPEPETKPQTQPQEKPAPDPTPDREVNTDRNSEEIALKKREEERKKQEQAEADRKAREEAERKAQEEAARKAREEAERKKQEEADELKSNIGDLFKSDESGSGRGNNDKPGNQGDPNGGDSDILEGISTGSGRVGGGLGSRGGSGPPVQDKTQAQGIVVIKVCVDPNGEVLSARFTQDGSTTNNSSLIQSAIKNAKKWNFKAGSVDKQCGTITYDFRLK